MNIIDKIKILLKLKKALKEVQNMQVKSGWRSSEFWMTVLTNVSTLVGALNGVIDPKTAAIIVAVTNCIYSILRSAVKNPDITTVVDNSVSK
jgi:hypothetical protein